MTDNLPPLQKTSAKKFKAYCANCGGAKPSSFRPGVDAKTGANYEDLCCDECHSILATVEGRPKIGPELMALADEYAYRARLKDYKNTADARAALESFTCAAIAQAQSGVLAGWKLVPVDLDEHDEITDAACKAGNLYRVDFIKAWSAALTATPVKPAQHEPRQVFESPRAKTLMKAFQEGWASCRDSEFVGEEAENDAFNQSSTVCRCVAEDILAASPQPQPVQHAPCKGKNCGITRTDMPHSAECYAEHEAVTGQVAKPAQDPLHDDIQSVLFEVEQAIENGVCPWQIEAAFEAYEAARRLQLPAHGIAAPQPKD